VYGDVKASALSMGHELGKMGDVGAGSPLRLNGEPIHVASSTEDLPLAAVLDRAEAGCKTSSAGALAELSSLPEALQKQIPPGARASGVLREDRGDRGVVACLVRPPGLASTGMGDALARLSALLDTGDLGQVGELRYVFAETTRAGHTHVVAAWTDGPFNLYALLPEAGHDAPGDDTPNAPRPPGAQRILSAGIEGVPYGVRLYDTAASPAAVAQHFDAEMASRGWEPSVSAEVAGPDQRAYSRPGADLLVITTRDGARTLVSLIEMRGR